MKHRDNPLMEPEFFTPPGSRRLFKGGGGGDQAYYKDLNRLYQEQADSAQLLRSVAEANLPGAVQGYVNQVQAITDPSYANTQASMAASDMASANAMERAATERSLTSAGVNPNDPRFAGSMRSAQVNNAARMAAGKNLARNDARKYQLAVAQDAVGTFTGQSNSAASQAGSASSGLANLAAQRTSADQQAAAQQSANVSNAVGGAMAAWSMFKDGGEVDVIKLADGGELEVPVRPAARWRPRGQPTQPRGKPVHADGYGDGGPGLETIVGSALKVVPKALQAVGKLATASKNPALRNTWNPRTTVALNTQQADAARAEAAAADPDNASYHLNSLKDGGEPRMLEQHALGDVAGSQQRAMQGFFAMPQVTPAPQMAAPQAQPQGPSLGQLMQTGKKVKEAAGGSKAAATTDKIGRIVGKFSESAGNQIQSHAAGMRMAGTSDQAGAAADAYRAAAAETKDAGLAQAYETSAANIEAGAGIQAPAPVAEAAIQPAGEAAAGAAGDAAAGAAGEAAAGAATEAAASGAASGAAASGAAGAAGGAAASGAAGAAGGAAASGAAGAAGSAAASTGLGAAMGAIGTAMPWIGAAYAVGSLLGAWNKGGEPGVDNPTQDLRNGDEVEGPGDHTADIIPALLSHKEGVLNGEAMALGGREAMKALNKKGLELREKGVPLEKIKKQYGLKEL